uniref:AsmA family protein n=1 Tax=Thaumasiovibrio occultus TaxID=1891184 RepID=UPI000B35164B|nr:AsmA family protein [Thaumasiovibrio occultus]
MKKLLVGVLAVFGILVITLSLLILLVNPNQFKPKIAEEVAKSTGLVVDIEGDLKWQFWPSLGIEMGKTRLENPAGFTEPNLLTVESVHLSVALRPLLSRTLHVEQLSIVAPSIAIETNDAGDNNLQMALNHKSETEDSEPAAPAEEATNDAVNTEPSADNGAESGADAWTLSLSGLSIANASVVVIEPGSRLSIAPLDLTIDQFQLGQWSQVALSAHMAMADREGNIELTTEMRLGETDVSLRDMQGTVAYHQHGVKVDSLHFSLSQFIDGEPGELALQTQGALEGSAFKLDVDGTLTFGEVWRLSDITSSLSYAAKPQAISATMSGSLRYDPVKQHLQLNQLDVSTLHDTHIMGSVGVGLSGAKPNVTLDLHVPALNVDDWTGAPREESASSNESPATSDSSSNNDEAADNAPSAASTPSSEEPDLTGLKSADVSGNIAIDALQASNVKVSNVKTAFSLSNGLLRIKDFTASLYGGSIQASGRLDSRQSPATYSVNKSLRNVFIQPLLVDAADYDKLEGRGNLTVALEGKGLSQAALRRAAQGKITLSLNDGAFDGVNVAEMLRKAQATLKGERDGYVSETKRTDFSAMSATIVLRNGSATNRDLKMSSPLLRVAGSGSTNLVSEALDYRVDASLVASSEGQGGLSIAELKDITVPIKVEGTWQTPEYGLMVDELLKQNVLRDQRVQEKAREELDRGLEKLLGEQSQNEEIQRAAEQLLQGLFN